VNIPAASIDTTIRDICEVVRSFGRNKSQYPFDLAFHHGEWWVTVEVDSPRASVEFETHDGDPLIALTSSLTRLRREARLARVAA